MSNEDRSSTAVRVFWGLAMGAMALILVSTGSGGIGKLQSFIVVTAVPVSLDPAALPLGRRSGSRSPRAKPTA